MNIKKGDIVTRNSYNNDTIFKVIKIDNNTCYLKGIEVRLLADAPILDLKIYDREIKEEDFNELTRNDETDDRDYFYLPAKILHIDGDDEYLEKCIKYYKYNNVFAVGKKIKEEDIYNQIGDLLNEYNPDIVIITGHDAMQKKKGTINDLDSYKNSKNFIKAIKVARKYEKSHEKLVIIAGACQSDYEELIKAGANYASSPKRINIHALDPAIIAVSIATTERNQELDLKEILNKTKYGSDGIGGIKGNGLMYVGYPR